VLRRPPGSTIGVDLHPSERNDFSALRKTPVSSIVVELFFGVGLASRKGRTLHNTSTLKLRKATTTPTKNTSLMYLHQVTKWGKASLANSHVLCLVFRGIPTPKASATFHCADKVSNEGEPRAVPTRASRLTDVTIAVPPRVGLC
jgi:hypothetical protein